MKTLIYGAGGFGKEVLWLLTEINERMGNSTDVMFVVDDKYFNSTETIGEYPLIVSSEIEPRFYDVVVAIGNPQDRKRVVESLPKETKFQTLRHPSVISGDYTIGEGSIICAGVILTVGIRIGKHCQLNLHTSIGHDCVIGDYFTSAPGARISGNCKIGDCVYVGTNACIREKITICDNVTIGMGAVVVKNITEPGIYIGNPLRKLEQ